MGRTQISMDYSSPREYEIGGITISGIQYMSTSTLVQFTGLSVGEKIMVPGEKISFALEKLWKQRLFSDVKITATKIEGNKIYLDIFLQERPRISHFYFKGVRKGEATDLEEKVNLERGTQVTENLLTNIRNIVKKYFDEKGFYRAEISFTQENDTAYLNTVILNINVKKNKKIKVKDITFEGNTVFSAEKLRRTMKETKRKKWYRFFKISRFIDSKYEEDKKSIVTRYNENGYRDMRIVSDTILDVSEKLVKIHIKIEEGRKYYFRNFVWVGNTIYPSEILTKALKIKKGDVYDQSLLERRLSYDQDAMSNLYMDNGYLFFNVIPVETQIHNDSVDLEMRIYEGKQATINRIIINGNTKTNEHVARREIRTYPGELFSKSDLIRSVRELAQLGHFDPEKIIPTPLPNMADGTVDLEYALEEKPSDQIEISGGWGADMIVGSIGIRLTNFAMKDIFKKEAWNPIPMGDGQQLSLRAQTNGSRYQMYSLSFEEPWLGGEKPNSLSVSTYYSLQTNGLDSDDEYYRSYSIIGASVGLGHRLKFPDDYFGIYYGISYQNFHLNNWNFLNLISNGYANNLSFQIIMSRNSVDNPIYSRTGSSFSLGLQLTPPYSLVNNKNYKTLSNNEKYRWVEYHKWTFNAQWFTKLVGDLVFMTRMQYGFLGYYNEDLGQSPFEGFSLGGDGMGYYSYGTDIIGLRGYENNSLTPSKGGNVYSKYTMEVRFPFALNQNATIYALTFAEAGNCWNEFNQFNPFQIYRSAGVGLRLFLPMIGMMGIDWGYGFDDIPGKPGLNGARFHFVLGQQF